MRIRLLSALMAAGLAIGFCQPMEAACDAFERYPDCVPPPPPTVVVNPPGPRPPDVPIVVITPPSNEGPGRGGRNP